MLNKDDASCMRPLEPFVPIGMELYPYFEAFLHATGIHLA